MANRRLSMTALQLGRKVGPHHFSRLAVPTLALAMLLGLRSPVAAATPSSMALSFATYAVATASHERPAHIVTAADVTNAVSSLSTISTNLQLVFNLGDVPGYTHLVMFVDQSLFTELCVNFPDTIGGVPRLVKCPTQVLGVWEFWPEVLQISERAVVNASTHGKAVSGADVVAAAKSHHLTLVPTPVFLAGQGGKVKLTTLGAMTNQKFTVNICVRFPKTAFGIPVQVAC
jgi:hypothetical protein